MRKIFICLLMTFSSIINISEAAVLTFDDISETDRWKYIPDGYGGFEWENAGISGKYRNPGSGYDNGTVSGEYSAFNPYAKIITVSRQSLFDFTGIYVTSAFYDFQEIMFTGYSEGAELYQATVTAGYSSPVWSDFSFYGIDTLIIETVSDTDPRTYIDNYFVLDNFTWEESSAPVPEPSTLILLSAGLITGIAGRRKVRKFPH
ncbi:MAG: PEP-CTERM sorting domain-containing protein [Desulfococcaceae bacterium]|nr:PEP-CTERM sorting domain-containing protein [Desulfococcaceae bacterium]